MGRKKDDITETIMKNAAEQKVSRESAEARKDYDDLARSVGVRLPGDPAQVRLNKVIFVGRHSAEMCAPWSDWAVISLNEPDSCDGPAKIADGWHSVLRLSFHDVTPKSDGMDALIRYADADDAKQIVEFVRRVAPEVSGIMVHCRAGISRSAAVVKWISGQYRIPFSWRYDKFNEHVYQLLCEAGNQK